MRDLEQLEDDVLRILFRAVETGGQALATNGACGNGIRTAKLQELVKVAKGRVVLQHGAQLGRRGRGRRRRS